MTSHDVIGPKPWMYSIKLEVSAKWFVQPSVHVYSDESNDVWVKATRLMDQTVDELKTIRYKVATENSGKECMKQDG